MIEQGKHTAKVSNYAIAAVKNGPNKGQPSPVIVFVTNGEYVYWRGSFTEAARAITLKALYHCGLSSPHKLPLLADGPAGGALDMECEVEIDVVHETTTNTDGTTKTHAKVAWVNPLGGMALKETMSKVEFAMFVSTLGLQGELVEIAKKFDKPKAAAPAQAFGAEIPF